MTKNSTKAAYRFGVLLAATVAALITMAHPVPGFARDTVQWAALDFPPFQIRNGQYQGSGSFDGLLDFLIRHLPEYDHEVLTTSFARREEEFRQNRSSCTPGLFRTPAREKQMVFSLPALIHLDNRVVFLASRANRFGKSRTVNLESLLKRRDLIGGIISSRSYAPNIDSLLAQYTGAPNIVFRQFKSWQVFEMLASGEIDYTILFPHEVAYLARQRQMKGGIVVRPIAGTPPYTITHVTCSKGPKGEEIIAHINRVLLQQRRTPDYRKFSERWYNEADKALIRSYYSHLLAPEGHSSSP
jgi:uncharacterized protein (TIGR02285 family)